MTLTGDAVKTKIENKIFSKPPATDIIITPTVEAISGTDYGYGGSTKTTSTPISTVGVPYGYVSGDRNYNSFGLNAEGTTKMAVKSTISVKMGDKITFTTTTQEFEVLKVNEYPYNNVLPVRILDLKEIIT